MEHHLRAELQRVKKEFQNLRVLTTAFFGSHYTRQSIQPHHYPISNTKKLEESFLDAFSKFERRLEEFDQKINNALSPDPPTVPAVNAASSPESPSAIDSPSAVNVPGPESPSTDSNADSPPANAASGPEPPSAVNSDADSLSAVDSDADSPSTVDSVDSDANSPSAVDSDADSPPANAASSPEPPSAIDSDADSPPANAASGPESPSAIDSGADSPSAVDPNADSPPANAASGPETPSAVDSDADSLSTIDSDADSLSAVDSDADSPSAVDPNADSPSTVDSVDSDADSPSAVDPNADSLPANAASGPGTPSAVNASSPESPSAVNTSSLSTSDSPRAYLGLSDLGEHLIRNLQTFIRDNNFASKLLVEDTGITSAGLANAVPPRQSSGLQTQFKVEHQLKEGIWHLYTNPLYELRLPDLSNIAKPLDHPEQYLEHLYQNLPEQPIPYYIGPLLGSIAERLQSYFPSGDETRQLGSIPGVSTLFGHVGGEASGTAFHCEDANLRSYNLTLVGWKIWVLIKPSHTAHFEELVRRLTNCRSDCDQFIRHTSVVIHPSRLRAENIEFDIISSGPGEMVVTQPRQYHAVVNRTASFAIATNFVLPSDDPIPGRLRVCDLDGLYHLKHPMIQQVRTRNREDDTQLETPPTKKPKLDGPLPLDILVQKITSRDTILRFMVVVHTWRSADDDIRGQLSYIDRCDGSLRPKALDTLRITCQENSQLFSFLEILASVHLIRSVERRRTQISPIAIDRLLEIRALTNTAQNRKSIRNDLTAYQKWDQLCGEAPTYTYDGILCFLPPVFKDYEEVTRTQIHRISKEDIVRFRSLLEKVECVQRLCEVGRAFQRGIFGSAEFNARPFEALTYQELSTFSLEDLLQVL